ncbi:hypothetical protein QQ045_018883 [Rhodiola kirilowii]
MRPMVERLFLKICRVGFSNVGRWLMLLLSSGSRLSKLLVLHRRFLPAEIQRMPLLLDQHLSQNMPAIKLCWSKVLHQVNMLLSAVKKYHLQLQDFVRQEM